MLRTALMSTTLFFGTSCVSATSDNQQNAIPTHSIEEIHASCSGYTTIDGCDSLTGKNITLNGRFDYPDDEEFHPNLFPLGTKISYIEDEDREEENIQPFSLWVYPSTDTYRRNLKKFHGQNVSITGKANTNCAIAHSQKDAASIDEDGNIRWLNGYCHSQSNTYLTEFTIKFLEQ